MGKVATKKVNCSLKIIDAENSMVGRLLMLVTSSLSLYVIGTYGKLLLSVVGH